MSSKLISFDIISKIHGKDEQYFLLTGNRLGSWCTYNIGSQLNKITVGSKYVFFKYGTNISGVFTYIYNNSFYKELSVYHQFNSASTDTIVVGI